MYGWLSGMETEKLLGTLLVRVWTSLDLGSTSYIKRYMYKKRLRNISIQPSIILLQKSLGYGNTFPSLFPTVRGECTVICLLIATEIPKEFLSAIQLFSTKKCQLIFYGPTVHVW